MEHKLGTVGSMCSPYLALLTERRGLDRWQKKTSKRVKTLSGFMKWVEQFNDGQYLFRGVSKHTHKMGASAYRRLPESERNNPNRLLKINQELIDKARLLGHDHKDGRYLSDLELLAELQHFGAATCLIDFNA